MNRISVILFALLVLLPFAAALFDDCDVKSFTTTIRGCRSTTCCRRRRRCVQQYKLEASWSTGVDGNATMEACEAQCDRHLDKCLDKCSCLAENSETINGPFPGPYPCKCTRNENLLSERALRASCQGLCRDAQKKCIDDCTKPDECPTVAKTTVDFTMRARGTCGRICEKEGDEQCS